jgi:hypothetical protein
VRQDLVVNDIVEKNRVGIESVPVQHHAVFECAVPADGSNSVLRLDDSKGKLRAALRESSQPGEVPEIFYISDIYERCKCLPGAALDAPD